MTPVPIVSNASPLISFERIGRLDLLHEVFRQVVIPPEVRREVGSRIARLSWISERALLKPIDARITVVSLGPGRARQ